MEILKQPQFSPFSMEEQAALLSVAGNSCVTKIPLASIPDFTRGFLNYLRQQNPEILPEIARKKEISPETEQKLEAAVEQYTDSLSRS
jgi:F-type H+-transporting ATPase subunit alpha